MNTYKTVEHPVHGYISQDAFGAKYVSDANGKPVKDEEGSFTSFLPASRFMMYVDVRGL